MLNVIILSAIMTNVTYKPFVLSVISLSVISLSVISLSVIRLNVIMLSVMVPKIWFLDSN
jgi:hypothetical protein